jgi:hypothetical protein
VAREGLSLDTRVVLLEGDADGAITQMVEMEKRLTAAIKELNERQTKILWTMVTMIVTLATAVIMFAANLITGSV